MFLISRANSLPRRASLTAFWCLVVAHLEWPLIGVYYLVFGFWCLISRETSLRAPPAPIVQPLPWRLSIHTCHKQVGGVQFATKPHPALPVTRVTDGASSPPVDDFDEQMM